MFWRVLYTNPRAEMKVAQRLTKIGIEAYCQARIEIRQRSDRKIKIWLSLLPSMVLVNIDEIQKYKGFEIQGGHLEGDFGPVLSNFDYCQFLS